MGKTNLGRRDWLRVWTKKGFYRDLGELRSSNCSPYKLKKVDKRWQLLCVRGVSFSLDYSKKNPGGNLKLKSAFESCRVLFLRLLPFLYLKSAIRLTFSR